MAPKGTNVVDVHTNSHNRDTQTQLTPTPGNEPRTPNIRPSEPGSGEVRVIVQPVQPVFYMPRQSN